MVHLWRALVVGGVGLVIAGCGDPPPIVPVVPPGADASRPRPLTEMDEPAAYGEQIKSVDVAKDAAKAKAEKVPLAEPTAPGEVKTTPNGVKYETLRAGTGPTAKGGQLVVVNYTGMFESGEVFDTSRTIDGRPYSFVIGVSPVIKGLWYGVAGMRVGERRKMTIPSDLAYGALGRDKIPANSILVFDVDLLDVQR